MAKYLLLFSIAYILTAPLSLQAQNIMVQAPPGYSYIYTEQSFTKETEGSPYLEEWQLSDIIFKNGKTISGIMLRYNVYTNQMLYQHNDKTYFIGAPDSISEINFPNKIFIFKEFTRGKKVEKSFFEILAKGEVSVLNKYEIKVIPSNYNIALAVGNKNDKLMLIQQLYLLKGDRVVILDKKSKLLEVLYDKNKEITDFIENKGLSFKNKSDVIEILTYYNQLK